MLLQSDGKLVEILYKEGQKKGRCPCFGMRMGAFWDWILKHGVEKDKAPFLESCDLQILMTKDESHSSDACDSQSIGPQMIRSQVVCSQRSYTNNAHCAQCQDCAVKRDQLEV